MYRQRIGCYSIKNPKKLSRLNRTEFQRNNLRKTFNLKFKLLLLMSIFLHLLSLYSSPANVSESLFQPCGISGTSVQPCEALKSFNPNSFSSSECCLFILKVLQSSTKSWVKYEIYFQPFGRSSSKPKHFFQPCGRSSSKPKLFFQPCGRSHSLYKLRWCSPKFHPAGISWSSSNANTGNKLVHALLGNKRNIGNIGGGHHHFGRIPKFRCFFDWKASLIKYRR